MRWLGALVLLAIAATARAEVPPALTPTVIEALTSIDSLPTGADYESVFAGDAVSSLAAIAQDQAADVGVQLRAIRGLSNFPGDGSAPHDALVAIIAANVDARSGSPVLILRAAIEALGALDAAGHAAPDDATLLSTHLNDASRDVRATTARALGQLCDTSAVTPLRIRAQVETITQVQLAISEALRVLDTCSPS